MTRVIHYLNAVIESLLFVQCFQAFFSIQASPHRRLPFTLPTGTEASTSTGTAPPLPNVTALPNRTSQPTPVPTTPGDIKKRWLNLSSLTTNLNSILRLGDNINNFSCGVARCGKQERRLSSFDNGPKCFCDKYCVSFGDCCYDYNKSCVTKNIPENITEDHGTSSCKYQIPSMFYGVTVINSCSSSKASRSIVSECDSVNKTDVLTLIPVLDLTTNRTYGNVFCASCNNKKKVTLWSVQASCKRTFSGYEDNSNSERKQLVDFVNNNCHLKFNPPKNLSFHHRVCIPRLHNNHYKPKNDSNDDEKLRELCNSYAFPLCVITPKGAYQWFKNPHCLLYQGITTFEDAHTTCPTRRPQLPPLTIFFDFHQTTTYSISSQRHHDSASKKLIQPRQKTCPENQGYDVFSGRCRVFFIKKTPHLQNETSNSTNCTYIKLTENEYRLFDNNSLFFANKLVSKQNYYKINDTLYACVNLTKNFTIFESRHTTNSLVDTDVLAGLTVAGFILSLIGLILLVATYFLLPELRNLPGKIILSLAMTMLVYTVLYFFINQSDRRFVCHMVGIGLHFCLLSMFAWMNVMAFDIHYTFTRKGKSSDRSTGSGFFTGVYLRYALYAWLVPLFITVVSVSLEVTHAFTMGYASGLYCFISNYYAKLYTLAIPVGLILVYNTMALCHTLINIRKVQKQATKATNQKHKVDLPIVCVKMTSVMGISWVIGFVAEIAAWTFLQYIHVILNSLQGFLIFVSYVLNKRVLKMYRSYLNTIRGKRNSVTSKRSTNLSPAS